MTFQPVVPFSGNAGWAFLQRTRAAQQAAFQDSPRQKRNVDAFQEKIAKVKTAADLVKDRQLLEVALGAFGLGDDINNRYFIEKILSSDTTDPRSLANRLSDKRYLAMAEEFGFGNRFGPRTGFKDFAQGIVAAYQDRSFEAAVGETAPSMRLALGIARDLGDIAERSISDNAKWFTVMANSPVRAVFEQALGMPKSIGALDLDRQLVEFRSRAERHFGVSEVGDFNTPDRLEELTRRFLIQDQLGGPVSAYTPQGAALALLQSR